MTSDITEFASLDPDRVDAVGAPANGTAWLMLKSVAEKTKKATLDADDRHALPDSDFAYIDSDGGRHLPVNDESHVRAAIARFNQTHFESDSAKKKAARKIMAAAKKHGIDVADDDNVAQVAKASVDAGPSLSQTRQNAAGTASASDTPPADDARPMDGGEPDTGRYDSPAPAGGDGGGDAAPDKTLPVSEADSQTGEVEEGRPQGDGDQLRREHAQTQKAGGKKKHVSMNNPNTPGSDAWEDKDVQLASDAESALANALRLVREFASREKTEAAKSTADNLSRAASALGAPATKGLSDMTPEELTKLLDERDKKARKATDTKKAKKMKKADKARKSTKGGGGKAAKAAATEDLSKTLESLTASLAAVKSQVETIAAQDAKTRPLTNATGIPRGSGTSAFKELEDRIASARNTQEEREARRQLAMAKMIAGAKNANTVATVQGPAVPLLTNRHALPDDADVRGL